MKKRNGFVFVETIIVIAFLATSLIMIYRSFTGMLTSEKRRLYYDDPIYLYRTYYILDFLEENSINNFVNAQLSGGNTYDNDKLLVEFTCYDRSVIEANSDAANFCESIINNKHFSVEHIYFTYYDTSVINECSSDETNELKCGAHESLNNLSVNARAYLKTLGGKGEPGYRVIIEYKETSSSTWLTSPTTITPTISASFIGKSNLFSAFLGTFV